MFSMDIPEMERLKDILFHSSAFADEAFHNLKSLREEMLTDINLRQYDLSGEIDDNLASALSSLLRTKETLYDLGCVVMDTSDLCISSERSKSGIITGES